VFSCLLICCTYLTHGLRLQNLAVADTADEEWQAYGFPPGKYRHCHSHLDTLGMFLLSHLSTILPFATIERQHSPVIGSELSRSSASMFMSVEDTPVEIALFDPIRDTTPFPIPPVNPSRALEDDDVKFQPSPVRYGFTRPIYLTMLRDLANKSEQDLFIGHCLLVAGDGKIETLDMDSMARSGTIGVASRIMNIDIKDEGKGVNLHSADNSSAGILSGIGAFRFEILEVVSTFPYPIARVKRVIDDFPKFLEEDISQLEIQVGTALHGIVTLSRQLESQGVAAQADEMVDKASEILDIHQRAVNGGLYFDQREQWEAFSLAVCGCLQLSYHVSVECVVTRSAKRRFEAVLEYLNRMLSELQALSALESLDDNPKAEDPPKDKDLTSLLDEFGLTDHFNAALQDQAPDFNAALQDPAPDFNPSLQDQAPAEEVDPWAIPELENGAGAQISMFGRTSSFTPADLKVGRRSEKQLDIPEGTRVEYFGDPESGWLKAKVTGKVESMGDFFYTLEFDNGDVMDSVQLYEQRTRVLE